MSAGLTEPGNQQDRRCALEGQQDMACKPLLDGDDDWCFGCKFYICDAHSRNLEHGGHGHDVMEHLLDSSEDDAS